jgi:hypothetical protein
VRYDSVPWSDRGHTPPEFVGHSFNLGAWNRSASRLETDHISLGSVEGGGQYLLEISGQAIESERCASMVTTGRRVQQLEIFRGRGIRECGGQAPPNKRMEPPPAGSGTGAVHS